MPSPTPSNDFVDSAAATLPKAGSGVRAVSGEPLFKAGDRIADNIELVSVLGVGGMGDVWQANHIGLDTAVAVKFMSAALAHDLALIERFAREPKLASRRVAPPAGREARVGGNEPDRRSIVSRAHQSA